jgi:hypothetical protein
MSNLVRFLSFKIMMSPILLQLLFWAGIAGTFYGTWVLYRLENSVWPIPLIVGPLLIRVIFERAFLAFQSFDELVRVRRLLEEQVLKGKGT